MKSQLICFPVLFLLLFFFFFFFFFFFYFFFRSDRILIFIMITFYHQVKISIDLWCSHRDGTTYRQRGLWHHPPPPPPPPIFFRKQGQEKLYLPPSTSNPSSIPRCRHDLNFECQISYSTIKYFTN